VAGALIVTAELGPEDFAWLDGLRRRHYPPERNRVPAHLTLLRTLPPSAEPELARLLRSAAARPAPPAFIAGTMDLGGGVAFRIASDQLELLRDELADRLHGLLTPQDSAGWSAHVTIQNKVEPQVARALIQALGSDHLQRPLHIAGLALHRYVTGQWETLRRYAFRG
jgi:hypothetical protein